MMIWNLRNAVIILAGFAVIGSSESEAAPQKQTVCIEDSIINAWSKVDEYWALKNSGALLLDIDPQATYAKYFYNYYLENPDASDRDEALATSFAMWHNIDDLESMSKAISEISDDSEVWTRILLPLYRVYVRENRYRDFIILAHTLENKLNNPKSKSELYGQLAMYYGWYGNTFGEYDKERAKSYHYGIIALNADSSMVDRARGNIYELDSLNVGQKAPGFSAVDIEGKEISLSKYSGRYVLLDFWATSCGPCVQEIPNLIDVYLTLKREEIEFIGISADEDSGKLREFVSDRNIPWPQIQDPNDGLNKNTRKYNVWIFPSVYFIGPDGIILSKWHSKKDLAEALRELMHPMN